MTKVKDTSLEAYKKLKLNEGQQRVLNYFMLHSLISDSPSTYKEVIRHTNNPHDQKRLNELVASGKIKQVSVVDGCAAYVYVSKKSEQERLRQLHTTKKPEIERYTAWLHKQRLKQHGENWYGKVGDKMGEYSHKQLVKAFKQSEKLSEQIIF